MIRKLTENDREAVLSFLSEEPSMNLFIIGDIEAFGFDTEFQEIWAEFNEYSRVKAVLLRFYQTFIPYAKGEFDIKGFVSLINNYPDPIYLSGDAKIVEKFEHFKNLKLGRKKMMYFAQCTTDEFHGNTEMEIKKACLEDVDKIIHLRKSIQEFDVKDNARDILINSMQSNVARTYYIEDNNRIVSCVSTSAENTLSAMIVGVCTHTNYRRRGLATAIMQKLFKDVLHEGKTLCLFYDNPEAGRIYKKLGFKDIGMWTIIR